VRTEASLPPELQKAAKHSYAERIRGASIYPAVQNIILACRTLELGTTITTNHIRCELEVKSVLGIPGTDLRDEVDRTPAEILDQSNAESSPQ
jgi:hypothetical protein